MNHEKIYFAIDVYMKRMFKTIIIGIPIIALFAGLVFTILKLSGFYTNIDLWRFFLFDGTCVVYFIVGLIFFLHCEDKEKELKPNIVFWGKVFISAVIVIQWNYISYLIPSRDFWAYFPIFILVAMFFLDHKYVLANIILIVISIVVSWIILPDVLLPVRGDNFVPELILRCILIVLVNSVLWVVSFLVEKFLVKELENIADYDSLTILKNRRTLNKEIEEAIENYDKNGTKFCFLMADIDDFKVVNDTYGHPFGDIVLKDLADLFTAVLGNKNTVFRYGGEEICVLIYDDFDNAILAVESLRLKIENQVHASKNIKVKVTMSMGVVEYKKGMSKDKLISVADSNLYYAKSHGKNKVVS